MEKETFLGMNQTAFPIAKAGYQFIGAAAFTTLVFALLSIDELAILGLIVTVFICIFFRDPDRIIPSGEGIVVSPADGKVIVADTVEKSPFAEGPCLKISIFMNIFNVHVNRVPHEGKLIDIQYAPGKFFSANLDKASADNEKNALFIETPKGKRYTVVQIAGLIARRIICYVQPGDELLRGHRFGMICFGSRLDVYLPTDAKPAVNVGDKVQAGTSVLAQWE